MKWEQVEGKWDKLKGKAKQRWGKLTDDDLTIIKGKRDELVGKLKERYGYDLDRAENEADDFLSASNE